MLRHSILTLALTAVAATAALAQHTAGGGIDTRMLDAMRRAEAAAPVSRALSNALAANSIDDLVRSRTAAANMPRHFSVETSRQAIEDQKSSGRCWMFSGLSVLRADFARMHHDTLAVTFSHDYLFFYDLLEKSNLMLQGVVDCAREPMESERVRFFFRAPVGDGGTFCGVADLVDKYGLVPSCVMPDAHQGSNTGRMRSLLASLLRQGGLELRRMVAQGKSAKAVSQRKEAILADVYHMLCLMLGEPPAQFTYAHRDSDGHVRTEARTYTPASFRDEVVGRRLGGSFVMLMNDPRRPYHKTYEVEWDRHTYDGTNWCYLNLPMEEIEPLAIAQLRDGRKLYSSYDVGKQLDRINGYCDTDNYDYATLLGTAFTMTKAERIATFDSGSTHAMTLAAVDLDAAGAPTAWRVENSWGAAWGQAGSLVMTQRWWRDYMFRLVVDKAYVPEVLLREAQQKPTLVMPEDPLFLPDE